MTELKKTTKLAWHRFLYNTPEGQEGMLYLRERIPAIASSGQPHELHFNAGVSEGVRRALDLISEIIAAEPKSPSENYDS